jgi:hypothetical protein
MLELIAVGLGIFGGFCLGYILGIKDGLQGWRFKKSLHESSEERKA